MTTHPHPPVAGTHRDETGKDPDRKLEKERDDTHEHETTRRDHDRDRRHEHDHEHQPEHDHAPHRRPDHPTDRSG